MAKRPKIEFYPSAMTVSGSDSGGGTGIAADLRTFNALGVFGTCAITAAVSQNPAGIHRIDPLAPEAVFSQIKAVKEKIAVRWIKTGMLFSAETVSETAGAIKKFQLKTVCDPEIFSAGGKRLLDDEAVTAMKELLLGQSSWIMPGIKEAELLGGDPVKNLDDMMKAAGNLSKTYNSAVWLKGDTIAGNKAVDVIAREGKLYTISSPRPELPPYSAHGAGSTLSAALTAMLALDLPWKQAVCESKAFVYGSLTQTVEIGPGTVAMYPPTEDTLNLIKLQEVE